MSEFDLLTNLDRLEVANAFFKGESLELQVQGPGGALLELVTHVESLGRYDPEIPEEGLALDDTPRYTEETERICIRGLYGIRGGDIVEVTTPFSGYFLPGRPQGVINLEVPD